MSQVMKWNYSGKADITLGKEIKTNPWPKIFLALIIFLIVSASVSAFIFKDYIYDIIVNPQIVLKAVTPVENGYEIEIPYKFEFTPEKFIDEINTKEYEAFLNAERTDYAYYVEGTVDTNIIGSYNLVYYSSNKINEKQINLTVKVVDKIAPEVVMCNPCTKKELHKNTDGTYKPIVVIRNENNSDTYIGEKDFRVEDFILSATDNYTKEDKLSITYPDKPDFSGNDVVYTNITYIIADESNNKTEICLNLIIINIEDVNEIDTDINQPDNPGISDDWKDKIDQIAQQEADKQHNENNDNENDNENDNYNDNGAATNDDGSNTVQARSLTARDFTWSVSKDGLITSPEFLIRARNNILHYDYNNHVAENTSGPPIDVQVTEDEIPGTFIIHWKCKQCDLSCDQNVTITK